MKCPNCGCDVRDDERYCSYCGYVLPPKLYVPSDAAGYGTQTQGVHKVRRKSRRARRAKGLFLSQQDLIMMLLFLILLLQIIQLLIQLG